MKPAPARKESIIEREIRLQLEREKELKEERSRLSTAASVKSVSPAPSVQSLHFVSEHPMKTEMNKAKQREDELKTQHIKGEYYH